MLRRFRLAYPLLVSVECRTRGAATCSTLAFEEFKSPQSLGQEDPRTCIVLHGLLGQAKNFRTFCSKMAEEAASESKRPWQIFSLDLRCHGKSTSLRGLEAPHSMEACGSDVVRFVESRLGGRTPDVVCGHSLGGKVALAYCKEVAATAGMELPKHAWILDSQPGSFTPDQFQDVSRVLEAIKAVPVPLSKREDLYRMLKPQGFSDALLFWMGSSLVPNPQPASGGLTWAFDVRGATAMYDSYCRSCYWHVLRQPPRGVTIHLVKAALSDRWTPEMTSQLDDAAQESQLAEGRTIAHILDGAGHWLHADQPVKLRRMMLPSFVDCARS